MSRVFLICALATMVPVAARAEPITVALHSATGGFSQSGEMTAVGTIIELGQLSLGPGASGTFFFNDAKTWRDYHVNFDASFGGQVAGLQVEILDPLGDGNDAMDMTPYPVYVPAGYSTSNNKDKLSFAQGSGLERSVLFAGGAGILAPDEETHRGDILMFSGLTGADDARVTFGLRDSLGGRGFLIRITAIAADPAAVPEPATMVLLGTGLAGLAAARRRRRAAAQLAS